jgi:3-(3-hydroxy-phenyl)propionate hydroxylase
MQRKHDRVIVAGGGPVGALAALLLAQRRIPVTVLEREAGVQLDYRASTFHPPTLDLLEECGAEAALLRMGLVAPVSQFRDRARGRIAEFDFAALKRDTRHPYRLQCEQFKLVGWLYGELAKIPGVELRFSNTLVGLRQDDDGVRVEVDAPDGRRTLACDVLIGADGGRSAVRKAADIGFAGFTYPEHFLVAGTRYDFKRHLPDLCSVNYTADPVEWYLLLEIPDMWRIITPVDPGIEPSDAVKEERIQASLQNLLPRLEPYAILVKAIYRVHQRVAETYRRGRVFLAGDAAHLNNPLGGMGLNGGIHDALSLTARLARVWHGAAPESELDAYEAGRRPEAIDAIHAITARNKRLMEERDPAVRERNLREMASLAADPQRAYEYMLDASMITSLRRCGMIGGETGDRA